MSAPAVPAATPPRLRVAPVRDARALGLPVVLIAAALVRAWHLGARSLWTDEGSTWTAAATSVPALLRHCLERDASPPLYYLLTWLALRWGDSETQLRLVSLVASVGLVWLTYRIARSFVDRASATLAAAVCALSPYQIMYAQEARTYALVAFLTVLALHLFVRAVLLDRRRAWLPFVLVSAAALWTQSIALLGVGVQGALIVLLPHGRRRAGRWVLAQLAAVALYAPWLLAEHAHPTALADSHWYVPSPDGSGVFHVLRAVFVAPVAVVSDAGAAVHGITALLPRPLAHFALALLTAVPLLLGAASVFGATGRARLARLALAALVLPLAAVFVVSLRVPLWLPRYFVLLTPWLALLLALGVRRMKPPALAWGWGVALLLTWAFAVARYDRSYTKEPWREVVAHLGAASGTAPAAALVPFDLDPFAYYDRRLPHPLTAFEVSHPDVPFASRYTPAQLDALERAARDHVEGFEEVWVVVRSPNSEVRREVARRAERAASTGRGLVGREVWTSTGGPLRVSHWRAGATAPATADTFAAVAPGAAPAAAAPSGRRVP